MICFRDMTFCSSEWHWPNCNRAWTPELQQQAERWWGKPGAPVAFANFCAPASAIEARSGETHSGSTEGESAAAKQDAQGGARG